MYILVGVSNLEEESGAAILDALTTGNFTNKGLKARYMRIPVSNLPNMLSAVGFPQTEIERYQQLITNKTKLNEREQKPQSTPIANAENKQVTNEVPYTPKGKVKQIYTVKGAQIFNKDGKEVFKEDSIDRNKIFANLRVLQGEAVIINYKDAEYVVNKKNQIISVTSGKIMQWGDENGNRKEILKKATEQFFLKSDNPLTRFYYSQPEEKRQRLGNLEDLQYQFEHSGVSIESFIEYLKCK
jgi:hypothetical protein